MRIYAKNKSLKDYPLTELLLKRENIEKRLNTTFQNLENYIDNTSGDFISNEEIYRTITRLQSQFYRSLNRADQINLYLPKRMRLSLDKYNKKRENIEEAIDERNQDYIKRMCEEIRSEDDEIRAARRLNFKYEPWFPPVVKTHGGNVPSMVEYMGDGNGKKDQ